MEMEPDWKIVRLTEDQVETVGRLINRAFVDEPIGHFMCPDPRERNRLLPYHFTLLTRYGCLFDDAYTTAGDPHGVALWSSPDAEGPTPDRWERAGVRQAVEALGAEAWGRFWSVVDYISRGAAAIGMPDKLWYLSLLAVDPSHQRQGIGSALMLPVLREADA